MDAAVKLASDSTRKETLKTFGDIRKAEDEVLPYVGKLALAFDSASAVYKAALDMMEIDVKDVDQSAYRAILLAQKKPGEVTTVRAYDHKATDGLSDRFPGLVAVRKV